MSDFVYVDYRPGKVFPVPFYVGIGSAARVKWDKRNRFHTNITKKYKDWERVVVLESESREDCIELEMFLIAEIGRRDVGAGPLVNLTDGGEGTLGRKYSDEDRRKRSESLKKIYQQPHMRDHMRNIAAQCREDPVLNAKRLAAIKDALNKPEVKAKRSEAIRQAHRREDVAARRSASIRQALNRPESKALRSELTKQGWKDPAIRTKRSEGIKAAFGREEVIEKRRRALLAAAARPEVQAKKSETMTRVANTPEGKAERSLHTKGTIWVNNGAVNKRVQRDFDMGVEWALGRIKRKVLP